MTILSDSEDRSLSPKRSFILLGLICLVFTGAVAAVEYQVHHSNNHKPANVSIIESPSGVITVSVQDFREAKQVTVQYRGRKVVLSPRTPSSDFAAANSILTVHSVKDDSTHLVTEYTPSNNVGVVARTDPTVTSKNRTVTLDASDTLGNTTSVIWKINGEIVRGTTATYSFPQPGSYEISLIVRGEQDHQRSQSTVNVYIGDRIVSEAPLDSDISYRSIETAFAESGRDEVITLTDSTYSTSGLRISDSNVSVVGGGATIKSTTERPALIFNTANNSSLTDVKLEDSELLVEQTSGFTVHNISVLNSSRGLILDEGSVRVVSSRFKMSTSGVSLLQGNISSVQSVYQMNRNGVLVTGQSRFNSQGDSFRSNSIGVSLDGRTQVSFNSSIFSSNRYGVYNYGSFSDVRLRYQNVTFENNRVRVHSAE